MKSPMWKVEIRDMYTDKSKSTCLAVIDIPSYDEAMQIRDNLDIEWTFNGKIDAKRFESCIYPSTEGAPEMWFYWKPKLGEKTPMISRKEFSLDEVLSYRNPMTGGSAKAGKPNHGYYVIQPRLMKAYPAGSHREQNELTRPFGNLDINTGNRGNKDKAPFRDGDMAPQEHGESLTLETLSKRGTQNWGEKSDDRHRHTEKGYVDREMIQKDLEGPATKEWSKIQEERRRSKRVGNRVTVRGRRQE